MSFNFSGLPSTTFPTPTNPVAKDLVVKAVKLTFNDFTTTGQASIKAYVPNDASIVGFRYWCKTSFTGGGITNLALAIGVTGTATKYASANVSLTANANSMIADLRNGYQEFDPTAPAGDIPLLFTGTATTGNPTAGEAYVLIEYIR